MIKGLFATRKTLFVILIVLFAGCANRETNEFDRQAIGMGISWNLISNNAICPLDLWNFPDKYFFALQSELEVRHLLSGLTVYDADADAERYCGAIPTDCSIGEPVILLYLFHPDGCWESLCIYRDGTVWFRQKTGTYGNEFLEKLRQHLPVAQAILVPRQPSPELAKVISENLNKIAITAINDSTLTDSIFLEMVDSSIIRSLDEKLIEEWELYKTHIQNRYGN
jgi:hypothetical protein